MVFEEGGGQENEGEKDEPSLHLHRASVRTYYYAGIGAHSGLITTATHVIHNG